MSQRAQYQDQLARKRYEDQLIQQVIKFRSKKNWNIAYFEN